MLTGLSSAGRVDRDPYPWINDVPHGDESAVELVVRVREGYISLPTPAGSAGRTWHGRWPAAGRPAGSSDWFLVDAVTQRT
jgi:hypothetical protein